MSDKEVDPYRFGYRYEPRTDESGKAVTVQVPMSYEALLHPEEIDFPWQAPYHSEDCCYLMNALNVALLDEDDAVGLSRSRVDWGVAGVKPHKPDVALFRSVLPGWNRMQETFEAARWGARPAFVLEITSPDTRSFDLDDKVVEYHRVGIPYYFIVDAPPELEVRRVKIIGYRFTPEGYVRIMPDAGGRIWMEPVRLWLAPNGDQVVCYDERDRRVRSVIETSRKLAAMEAELRRLRGESS